MATETLVPSAPVPSSAPAPSATTAPVPNPTGPSFGGGSKPTSSVDPGKYAIREDYAAALLKEKLGEITAVEEMPATIEEELNGTTDDSLPAPDETAAEIPLEPVDEEGSAEKEPVEQPREDADEEDFQLEPETIVTPEILSQMITENAEFGRLLATDPKLKGQIYKTAREAAELKPYREIFPDLEAAKTAQNAYSTWNEVRETFMGSTTREGTVASLNKIAELSYERDADGNVVTQNGQPVIGEDYFGFVDNVAGLKLEQRNAEVSARLKANRYASEADRLRDERVKAAIDTLREDGTQSDATPLPEAIQRQKEELDRRERALNERQHGEKISERRSFESGLQTEAQKRIGDGINRILANVEKQGGVISPYLKNILPKAIGAKLIRKIQANPTLQGQMQELQRLPLGDASRHRRLAAIDRAVQQYLPDVAREELREAGVQIANAAQAKRAKLDAQIDSTKKTEPKGSIGPAGHGSATMSSTAAFDHAQAEWQRANPGRPFDKVAKEAILPRVLQLMTQR